MAASVLSRVQITPQQLAQLAEQFGGQKSPDADDEFNIKLGPGMQDAVGFADGSDDIGSMPDHIIQDAARWLGGPPTYRLAIQIGDTQQCIELAWRIANTFAQSWPAVWSNHTAEPVVPLGDWWRQ